jgi:carboxyl-terminal processing protease
MTNFFLKKRYLLPTLAAGLLFVSTGFKDDFFEIAKQIEIFTELFKTINQNYVDDVNPADLMDKSIKTMVADLDPYTNYYNEQDVNKARVVQSAQYAGIGAMIARQNDKIILKECYKNFAADKAGLHPGDEIIQINDVILADYNADAEQLMKGSKNTKITIKYIRQGKTAIAVISLDEQEVKSVPFHAKIDDKTGYIVLTQFTQKASSEVKAALEDLKKQGAENIVLDLRGNPGGLLQEAVNICNLFVPKNELIVTTKGKVEKYNETYKTNREPIDLTIPLVVLVDGKSASASEIVSGALQDLDRAVIVGCRSFGKGLVQRPMDLVYGTSMKLTISRYYTPAGRCIQALDYWHKDKDGKPVRTQSTNFNAFKTKKNRTVYDGGGVLPDVVLNDAKLSDSSELLLKNDGIFNYVTQYFYKNPNLGNKIPTITDVDYQDFKLFLKKTNFSFNTETELALKNTLAAAKKEKLDETIAVEYQQLATALQKSQEKLLDKNQSEIKKLLTDEIIKRYQYKEGLYQYYIKNNAEILKAAAILNNPTEYKSILKL